MSVSILLFDFFFKVDVGFGFSFSNCRDIGVDFDFLTNIPLQGKSVRLMFVCHLREVCKKLTAVVNSLFYLVLQSQFGQCGLSPTPPSMEWNGEW